MKHFASPDFWFHYRQLTPEIQALADTKSQLLKANPHHPSLRFKKIGNYWSARISLNHRAVATERKEGLVWFWIGPHDEYERLLKT